MKIGKLPYYFKSLRLLARELHNSSVLFSILKGKAGILRFKSGLEIEVLTPLDVLICIETLIYDEYRLKDLVLEGVILDGGAGIGDFSLHAAKLFPETEIHAFEPDPAQYQVLLRNIERNEVAGVKPYNFALGSGARATITRGQVGALNSRTSKPGADTFEAEVVSLSPFLHGAADLLKIDCEGAELDILQSLSRDELMRVKTIVLEYHDAIRPGDSRWIQSHLEEHGFHCELEPRPADPGIGLLYATRHQV